MDARSLTSLKRATPGYDTYAARSDNVGRPFPRQLRSPKIGSDRIRRAKLWQVFAWAENAREPVDAEIDLRVTTSTVALRLLT